MKNVEYTAQEKVRALQHAMECVVEFALTPQFSAVFREMFSLPYELRYEFVELVLLDPDELLRRDVRLPSGIDIQRSWFADERPTLFCITKRLPPGMGWKVATVTIDNPLDIAPSTIWMPPVDFKLRDEFKRPAIS